MQGHLKLLTQNLSRNMEELDSEPMMVVPSPGAFSLSPKSQTESTVSLFADESCGFISEFEGHCFAGLEILKPYGLFPPILSSLWCWLHVEERLMLAVISHPANLFAEQGTENMSEIHRCMLHCSNH